MDHEQDQYVTLSSRVAYEGEIITVRQEELRLPDGTVVGREVVEHPGAVGIVAVDAEDRIVLVRQYRQPARRILEEIPAGKLAPGEAPEQCAIRELAEETGYVTRTLKKIGDYYTTPGFTNERFHMFLATDLEVGERSAEGDEELSMRVVVRPFAAALDDAQAGRLEDGKTIVGLLLAAAALDRRQGQDGSRSMK